MTEDNEKNKCFKSIGSIPSCVKVESIVSIDSKGQILFPKDFREKANMKPGDKLVAIHCGNPGCVILINVEFLGDMVKNFLGPVMNDIFSKK